MIEEVKNSITSTLREIPATIWVFLVGQLVATVIWGVRLDSRVANIENKQNEGLQYIDKFRELAIRSSLMEERLRVATERTSELRVQIQELRNSSRSSPTPPP